MILIAEFDDNVTAEDLLAGFSHIETKTKIDANIKEMEESLETEKGKLPLETYVVTAQGKNRKGLVKTMGDFFYQRNINVLDLVTTREKKMYTMIFQVDLSVISSMEILRKDLQSLAVFENMDLVLQHNDIFTATNEIGTQLHTMIAN